MDVSSVIDAARVAEHTIATAESLTGGLVAGALTSVTGASEVFVGAVVAYDVSVKARLLGVDEGLLASEGPVSEGVALAMAEGVRSSMGADVAVATTGVAGPESHGGKPAGTVCIAGVGPGRRLARTLTIPGDRNEVRLGAVDAAIVMLVTILSPEEAGGTMVE